MKYHIVFDSNHKFVGTLADKLDVKLFKEQRDMNRFRIYSISAKKIEEMFGETDISNQEAINVAGVLLFPDEEVMLYEGFDQLQIDYRAVISSFLRNVKPFIRFNEKESQIVNDFLAVIYEHLEEYRLRVYDYDEEVDPEEYFDTYKLAADLISKFGGKLPV